MIITKNFRFVIAIFFLLGALSVNAAPNLYGGQGLARTWSAETVGNGKFSMGLGLLGTNDNTIIKNSAFYTQGEGEVKFRELLSYDANLFVVFGLSNYVDIGAVFSFHQDKFTFEFPDTHGPVTQNNFTNLSKVGMGDIKVWGKLQYPPYEHSKVFEMSLFGAITAPTGTNATGAVRRVPGMVPVGDTLRNAFAAEDITGEGMMLWTVNFAELDEDVPLKLHLNYGLRTSLKRSFENSFLLRTGLEFQPHQSIILFSELTADSRFSRFEDTYDPTMDQIYFTPGITLVTPQGFTMTVLLDVGTMAQRTEYTEDAGALGLQGSNAQTHYSLYPTHNLGFGAVLAWTGYLTPQDKDQDGIIDEEDMCPKIAEDFDKFEDNDGCPEDDNDQDEIMDADDKCPDEAEDKDGFEDEDGCPEVDNDKDGINDVDDKCPLIPEDRNNFEDDDGCPDSGTDSDMDGVVDISDRCPTVPEDKDGFEDFDGCPEEDNDKDGFKDAEDKCPNVAEVRNGFEDDDGCPDVKPKPVMEKKAKIILKNVNFATGSAKLTEDSFLALDEVVKTLKENPEVHIRITGYTDNRGSDKLNKKLSGKRAQSVVDYFITQGIAASRLKAVGKGKENPIASNRTAEGRAENRRIEMYRTQ